MYPLNNLAKLEAKQEKDGFVVKLVTQRKLKLTMKFGGKEAAIWAAAVVCGNFSTLAHTTHGSMPDGIGSTIEADLREKPNTNVYTGSRQGYVAPPKDGSGEEKKKEKESGGNSDEKKESRKLKKTVSKSTTKNTSSESKKKKKTLADTQTLTQDVATARQIDEQASGESDPDEFLKIKKTQTLTDGTTSSRRGNTVEKAKETVAPNAATSVNDDKKKTSSTNSDENDPPAKK